MRCIALQHVPFEDLGLFAPVLAERGYAVEYRDATLSPLTDAEWRDTDLIVVLGGPISVYETEAYPWIADEITGVGRRLAGGGRTLGICLGAQLMAATLGANVYPGAAKEIGWAEIQLTRTGDGSCLRHLRDIPVLHWHGDTFDLPRGATLLASTPVTPHQAFAIGDHALALQFHPEVEGSRIEPWLVGHTCELGTVHMSVSALRNASHAASAVAAEAGRRVIADWLGATVTLEASASSTETRPATAI